MKKILYILSIALLGVTACNLNEQPEPVQQDGTVTFVMGIEFPDVFVATRAAMDTDPIIDDIHVALSTTMLRPFPSIIMNRLAR